MDIQSNSNRIIQNLLEANPLREPTLRSIIRSLGLPRGSHGLDAGCGIGLQAFLLAEAVGPEGHVTGLDILPELIAYGEDLAAKMGLSEWVTFRPGDVRCLPFEEDTFDWAWSADCIGYPAGELAPLLQELVRVVKPGGSIILIGWSSQQLLPGYPSLEARLNATCSGYIPFLKDKPPEWHFMRASGCFRNLGLEDVEARTFVGEVQARLKDDVRTALTSLFEMLWGAPQAEVSTQDWVTYKRLCMPGSPDFILDIPDYYAFFTYSMFRGRISKR
jgi:demethylmenaquinone methyltransferase/2-methoxy-6-polyprenyl-1,4-benzoquinol methylase